MDTRAGDRSDARLVLYLKVWLSFLKCRVLFQNSSKQMTVNSAVVSLRVRDDVGLLYDAARKAFLHRRLCEALMLACKKLIQPLHEVNQVVCQRIGASLPRSGGIFCLLETN